MKHLGKMHICALAVLLLAASGRAALEDARPYKGIAERNVFNLHAQLPIQVSKPDPAGPPRLELRGITTILGRKLAFLVIPKSKPGVLSDSVILGIGESQNEVEVEQIDERVGIVRVVNHGKFQLLDFDHDGARSSEPLAAPVFGGNALPPPAMPSARSLQSSLSPEEQAALIEVQRLKYQQEDNAIGRILPPTELTPEMTAP